MFYENIGQIRPYSSFWQLIVYKNISFFEEKFDFLQRIYKRTSTICKRKEQGIDETTSCLQTLRFVENQIPIILRKIKSVSHLTNHKQSYRSKRGVFNGIGKVLHWSFGVADADDTEYYDKIIDKVSSDEENISILMKEQIHVIKSTIVNFNESVNSFRKNEKILNNNIMLFNTFLDDTSNKMKSFNKHLAILTHLNLITYLASELSAEYDELIDSILFAQNNIIHPSVISPVELIKELNVNSKLLTDGKEFPIPLIEENAFKLLEISRLKTYYTNNKLIFVLDIPLPVSTTYQLYRLIPLPIALPNTTNTFAYVKPHCDYVAMAQSQMTYVLLKEVDKCKEVRSNEKICEVHTIYSTMDTLPCEVSLLTSPSKNFSPTCSTRMITGKISIWEQLLDNQWIFVLSNSMRLTVSCNRGDIYDVELSKTGILSLNENCKGYTEMNQLIPNFKIKSQYNHLIPQVQIIDDCCENWEKNKTKSELHLETISLTNLKLEDLNVAHRKLEQLDQHVNKILENSHIDRYQKWYTVILSIIGSLIGVYLTYKFLLCTRIFSCFSRKSSNDRRCCVQIFNQCANRSPTIHATDISLEQIPSQEDQCTTRNDTVFRVSARKSVSQPKDMRSYPDL